MIIHRPPVTIVCTTYFPKDALFGPQRRATALRTIESWGRHLRYDGDLSLHIADDGSADEDWPSAAIAGAAWETDGIHPLTAVTASRQERRGVGASLNVGFGVAYAEGGFAAMFVDDWMLHAPFDITPWVDVLRDDDERNGGPVGMVRLGPPHPWLTGTIQTFPSGWGMRLDRHHYAFGHRPALYHPRMRDAYGEFAEGVNAYDCERLYAERWCATPGPDIVLALPDVWEHQGGVELGDVEPGSA